MRTTPRQEIIVHLTRLYAGFQISFGVLLRYYKTHASFGDNPFLPSVGLLSLGILKLGSCATTPLMIRYPQYRRHLVWGGWMVCLVALVASSSASEQLVLSLGVAYSIGFSVLYYLSKTSRQLSVKERAVGFVK